MISDDDLDRIEESPRAATDRHVVALVAEVRQRRASSANAAALVEEVWTLKSEMADLGKRATNAIELAKADRDRLADAIRTHRESTVTELTCCQDCRDAGKQPWLPERDRDLYAALDQDVDTFPSRCRCDRVVPCRHCSQEEATDDR